MSLIFRSIDITLSLIGIILASPIIFILVIVGVCNSGSPFFIQERLGLNKKPFHLVKLRTMTIGTASVPTHLLKHDNTTGFGKFLRKTKLDELPQLWNILTGDMSFVGPRPEDPFIVSKYYDADMLKTLTVRPGLTGPGSIFGYLCSDFLLDDCSPEESYVSCLLVPKLSYERYYVDHLNIIDDFRFLCITPVVILLTALRFPLRLPRWIKSYPEMSS